MTVDDRERIRDFYDNLGEREWSRLEETPRGRVAYQIHRQFLERFVHSGDYVLEVGAGPGRFTFDLARLGAIVDVTDLSQVQLDLHRQHLKGTDADFAVASRSLLDICDTSRYDAATFDAVVAYGGPLSYAFERTEEALRGLLRITKPGGVIIASVMSWLGSWRHFLPSALEEARVVGDDAFDLMLTTGDLRHSQTSHVCQMFRARDISELVSTCGAELVAMSASNWASLNEPDVIERLEADPIRWTRFIEHEVAACAEPGALDGGTHVLFAVQRDCEASGKT
ncbi:MAG: class I SAM-dependent methyltransferase [Acidimicrobiales bacterium]